MSVNKRSAETAKKLGGYVFSVICGMLASGAALCLFSAVMYALGLPPETAGALAFISFAGGCFLAGFICGTIKKRGGLRCGFICAAAMTVLVFAVSALTGGLSGSTALVKTVCAVIASCAGAVWGVNRGE